MSKAGNLCTRKPGIQREGGAQIGIMSHVATKKAHLIPESVSVYKQAMLVRPLH